MPPKKKKKQSRKTTQSQRQSQKVIVNIGSTSKPRKKSGRGGLPPPSYQHNLAPTFITAPQVDYTPLLAMMQHHARPIVEQAPMPTTQTPLSATIQASNAEQMAGEAAIRRAGPTAANFQVPSSETRMRVEPSGGIMEALKQSRPEPSLPKTNIKERRSMAAEDIDAPQTNLKERRSMAAEDIDAPRQVLRPPDPYVTQTLVPTKSAEDFSAPEAEARFVPPPSAQQAEVVQSKTPVRQKQQTDEKRSIKDIIDRKLISGEPLTQAEISRAMLPSTQIGNTRKKRLIEAGYTQFQSK